MPAPHQLAAALILALSPFAYAQHVDEEPGADAEPVDPAEQRVQRMPPPRPERRGAPSSWVELGPAPTRSAQVRVPPNNEVAGAVHSLAPHPTNADILYAGSVNGGVWRTNNATAASPNWVPLTDSLPSQSIGDVSFDPTDATHQTLIVGVGRWSNFARRGDDEIGVYHTIDGGLNWRVLGGNTLLGQRLLGAQARGNTYLAAANNGGLFRSTDSGTSWSLVSGTGGLPTGGIAELAADPSNNARFYLSVIGANAGVFRSDSTGQTWTNVSAGITIPTGATTIRIAVSPNGQTQYVAVVGSGGALTGVFRSANSGAAWTAMDVPAVHPGTQGTVNTAIAADPTNPNLVYISGDRITVSPFTANVQRGDAGAALGSQFTSIVDGGASNTSPHADSRDMAFDATGNLLQSDDGGIYRRLSPATNAVWQSVIGNLNVMEVHDLAHDRVTGIVMIGTQDNGTHQQQTPANTVWTWINGGDGGDVAIDGLSLGSTGSFRFLSSQNLGGFRRAQYNSANTFVSSLSLPGITGAQFVTPTELNITDPSRMLVGGLNNVFELTGANGATPTMVNLGTPGANRNAMAFGTTNNANAAYVGKNAQVFKRDGSTFVATSALPAGANTITDVAMAPGDDQLVFAVDDDQVFRSTDGGNTWTDVTGNLPMIASVDFRTIEFAGNVIALGTRSGVYIAGTDSSSWSLLGTALPDVLVFDLRFVPSNTPFESGTLYAGTLGRGVWRYTLSSAPGSIFRDGFEGP